MPEEKADCIVPLHCLTGCDANSAREEAIEELFEFTSLVVCGDKVSRTMGAQAAKWKAMKNKSFIRLPPGVNIAFVRTTWLIWCITPP